MHRARRHRRRRGFTLLETILASVVGSLVLAAVFSVMIAMNRAEQTMSRASRHMEELALTQQVLRRSFMSMVLIGKSDLDTARQEAGQDQELTAEELAQLPRPRIILGFDDAPSIRSMLVNAQLDGVELLDPAGYGVGPQRLEIVLPDKPVPESMRLFPAAWVTRPDDDLVASFDPSGVQRPETESGVRGAFELRPDGARERIMEGYGLVPATGLEIRPETPAARVPPDGWTLWWRPVYGEEYWARQRGEPYDADAMPMRLAEAVPLIRGIRSLRWTAFAAEENQENPDGPPLAERWPEYEGSTVEDIPGYVEMEVETTSGTYANWMFELGWSLADESLDDQSPPADGEEPDGEQPAGDTPDGQQPGQGPATNPLDRLGGQT